MDSRCHPQLSRLHELDIRVTGAIDLSAYAGKKIKVAFHYIGTAAKSGTWELNKLNVYGTK